MRGLFCLIPLFQGINQGEMISLDCNNFATTDELGNDYKWLLISQKETTRCVGKYTTQPMRYPFSKYPDCEKL